MAVGNQEIREIERGFWLNGAEHFREYMASGCIMVLPDPVGILESTEIPKTLEGAPRWQSIEMSEEKFSLAGHTATFAYRAESRRGEEPYRALCSSTYVQGAGGWRLLQHQQTPIG